MTNPFIDRENRKKKQSTGYWRSAKQEKETAKKLKANLVSGSGCGKKKGDVFIDGVLRLECKTTEKKSFSLKREIVEKIQNAAIGSGEIPAVYIEFINDKGTPDMEVAVVPTWAFELLLDSYKNVTQ